MEIETVCADDMLPVRAHKADAGADLKAARDVAIRRGDTAKVSTGVRVSIPEGCFGLLAARSSLCGRGLMMLNGVGIIDIVENRVVGMKSRGVYETPGGTILMEAHQQLEELILDRDTYAMKTEIGAKFASLIYEGKWFTPLREAMQAFIEVTQEYVTGEVKFKLYKGNIIKAGTTSPYSLYNESLASFKTGDLYDHHDAEGFINLFGLSLKVRAMKKLEVEKNNK